MGRAVLDNAVVHIPDVKADPEYDQPFGDALRVRAIIGVPMVLEDRPIGAISVWRFEPHSFTDKQIALLKIFAAQAVIAIENVRLFTELQEKNQALTEAHAQVTEALDQQTATSEILRVIASSPTNVQPVFDTIVNRAPRLCGAKFCLLYRFDGELVHLVAHHNAPGELLELLQRLYPMRPWRQHAVGRAIMSGAVVQIEDALSDPEYQQRIATMGGWRSMLAVPMLRDSAPIGAIVIQRAEVGPFPEAQVALLRTFADQAVIAVENVRLFEELESRNRALTEALDQQTSTSEILRVISGSPTDAQPVFDTIVESAVKLCRAEVGLVTRLDGEWVHLVALHADPSGIDRVRSLYPGRPSSATVSVRAIRDRAIVHISDLLHDSEYETTRQASIAAGFRAVLSVPMRRGAHAIGALTVGRAAPGRFSDTQVDLLKTFADQAVIAIENARLFKELQARTEELTRSVDQLTALGDVGRAISSTLDLETVLTTIVSHAVQLSGPVAGAIYEYDERAEEFRLRATENFEGEYVALLHAMPLRRGEGVLGRVAVTRQPVQVPDILQEDVYESRFRDALMRYGYRALLAVPLLCEDRIIGGLVLNGKTPGEYPPEVVELLKTFATQSALAIQNARLFHEIEDKSRQLEAASQHKSEFLANMSHELRTPLNAVIGFSEVLLQRMFGDLNAKQDEYLKDIYSSGQHLLSLINDILDLSKIEAGRMELAPAPFHLPSALDNAVTLVKERAARHGVTLQVDVDPQLGELVGDERKVKQVLLNLLSNAVKFTPEGGRISLKASRKGGVVEIAVTDTGIGIAPEDQAAIFEEFRQVGSDETRKQEGTGLGLTLAKKFVELHGGRIWVESEPGRGSTFTFTLPLS
jgi:signal transduction histidine kinase